MKTNASEFRAEITGVVLHEYNPPISATPQSLIAPCYNAGMSEQLPRGKAIFVTLLLVGAGLVFTAGGIAALIGLTTRPPALFYSLPAAINFAMAWYFWSRRAHDPRP